MFCAGTLFRCPNGDLTRVEEIQTHETLMGHNGVFVDVSEYIPYAACEEQDLVSLHTNQGSVVVTAEHRVVVMRGVQRQTIPAGHLYIGMTVCCTDGEETLIDIRRWRDTIPLFKITFSPDVAIETFNEPRENAILTKGCKLAIRTRRSGMTRRSFFVIAESTNTIYPTSTKKHGAWP